jgi:hypothetical protein
MEHGSHLPNGCELVTGGGFNDQESAKSTVLGDLEHLKSNHEEADTRLILHACDAVNREYNRIYWLYAEIQTFYFYCFTLSAASKKLKLGW